MNDASAPAIIVAQILEFYGALGWDELVGEVPQNRLMREFGRGDESPTIRPQPSVPNPQNAARSSDHAAPRLQNAAPAAAAPISPLGLNEALGEAQRELAAINSLDDLSRFTENFSGWGLRKTATHFLFNSGNPAAQLMVIGECPSTEDDLSGEVFSDEGGILFDKMMAAIGRDRKASELENSLYLTYSIHWRPPGNRSPTQGELDLARPFVRKHIELIRPKFLLVMGAVPVKILWGLNTSLHKLRGQWMEYEMTDSGTDTPEPVKIPALITYAPHFLLTNPNRKRESWQDLQELQQRLQQKPSISQE
ncbi:MAG: uracil-DNA glycosylase [Alphaproteobacteria bacterium]|nr:uracil-DNA glycosylase [Alphaproteobacteria bacterium]